MKRKIYVASSWRNEHQQGIVESLRNAGHEVYDFRNPPHGNTGFAWSEIDPNWQNWTTEDFEEALKHPLAIAGFKSDFDGMAWADTCVMVLPCGRSANTEAGFMKGAGKEVFVLSMDDHEPELMYKMHDGIFDSLTSLVYRLEIPAIAPGYRPTDDIQGLSSRINTLAHERGFWKQYELHKKLLLIISEATEAMEADRKGRVCNGSIEELTQLLDMRSDKKFIEHFEANVKHTFPDELADIIIRTLDLGYQSSHHMALHINLKHRYNSAKKPDENKKY